MSYSSERRELETRFGAAWTYTAVKWPNVSLNTTSLSEWVRFTNVTGEAQQMSMGDDDNVYRYPGLVTIGIFVRANSGATRALELSDLVCDIWRSAKFDGIQMHTPHVSIVGDMDAWYQVNVTCSYYRDSYQSRSA